MAKPLLITPKMIVRYAFLTVPTVKYKPEGQYIVKCVIEDGTPEAEELKAMFDKLLAEQLPVATKDLKPAQRKNLIEASPYSFEEDKETGEETGYLSFNFSMPAQVTRKKDGKVFEFTPDIFDSAGKPFSLDGKILGNGSIVQVGFTADRAYCMEGKDPVTNKSYHKAGISIDMKAVMIHSMASTGQSAASYGFDTSGEGFPSESHENPFDNDNNPPAPTDGDF